VRAVDGVDLTTDAGEVTLIMGPSGSGKTTLLSLIGALLRPTEGRIAIDGVDITALHPRDLPRIRRETVGFVFQSFNLLDTLTAEENVEIALNVAGVNGPPARERARNLLVQAGLEGRLGFRTHALSGGERQRVAIARALANRPRLLLVDEPTANLDSRHGAEVVALLREMATHEGCGVVIVSHDPRVLDIADRVLWMEDGRIVRTEERAGVAPA
jgi:putative ABC transport system ATP-binding protein